MKRQLASSAHSSTESCIACIQGVLALCHKVDAVINEPEKVGHMLKGIQDAAFHLHVCKNCTTVEAIFKECQRFEQFKSAAFHSRFLIFPTRKPPLPVWNNDYTHGRPPIPLPSRTLSTGLFDANWRHLRRWRLTRTPLINLCLSCRSTRQSCGRNSPPSTFLRRLSEARPPASHLPRFSVPAII